ncbi:MAG: hypothetical protein ACI9EB_000220 [Pseudomonas sp.]|jgi:hypothetical protein
MFGVLEQQFKLRLGDAFCRIAVSLAAPWFGLVRSCRMAAMPSAWQPLQSFQRRPLPVGVSSLESFNVR